MNGDGLPDIAGNGGVVYLNTGSTWSGVASTFPTEFVSIPGNNWNKDLGVTIGDINGDGLPDVIKDRDAFDECDCIKSDRRVWLHDGIMADTLTSVSNEKGGLTTIAYGRTNQLDSTGIKQNPALQIALNVVKTVAADPGFGGRVATTTYQYSGGLYDLVIFW